MKRILDSRQLLAFATLARRGSFTLAAKELFLTQSAVSHAIKALEEEVGCRLFDRVGKHVSLTLAGEYLQRHAERVLAEMQDARSSLEELAHWGHGRLRLGASTTACEHILPPALREFRRKFPECPVGIAPGDVPRQLELLRTGHIDLAVMLAPAAAGDVAFLPLFEDELSFLVSPAHPWARAGGPAREEIGAETLLLYNQGSYTFRLVVDYFREDRITLRRFIELGSMEAIKEFAKIGLGAGVLAPWVAAAELASGTLVARPLGQRRLQRSWGIGHRRGRRLTLAEETFVGLCRDAAEKLVRAAPPGQPAA